MYASYFGLTELPFNVTPDPRFLYVNECYQEAIAALRYGIEARKGFIALVGEAGTGKTTMLRRLLDQLDPSCRTVLLMHPTVTFDEILEHILLELGIPVDGAKKLTQLQRLNEFLIEHTRAGGNVALLIDEAQDLDPGVMEELRLLSNLETGSEKILQIVLAGQPELDQRLADGSLRQLRQRITLQIRLRQLQEAEVSAYVQARLAQVGGDATHVFEPEALRRIAEVSHGIPRVVNVVCDAAMLQAFATGSPRITPRIVDEAWADYSRGYQAMSGESLPPAQAVAARTGRAPEPATPPVAVVETATASSGESSAAAVVPAPADPAPIASSVEPAPAMEPPAPEPPAAEPMPPDAPVADAVPQAGAEPPRLAAVAAPRHTEPRADDRAPTATPPAVTGGGNLLRLAVAAAVVAVVGVSVAGLLRQPPAPPAERTATATTLAPIAEPTTPPSSLADVSPSTTSAVAEVSTTTSPPTTVPEPPAPVAEPLPPADARALIEAFRSAYEAQNLEALAALLAPDVQHNDLVGRVSMIDEYDAAFAGMRNVSYRLASLQVVVRDQQTMVSSPFVITYKQADGKKKELRGSAEWQVERRDGRPVIAALKYRFES